MGIVGEGVCWNVGLVLKFFKNKKKRRRRVHVEKGNGPLCPVAVDWVAAKQNKNKNKNSYPKFVKNGKNCKNGRNFGGFFREKIVRGVGSSHRGYSIFFGKFFKKARIFAEHNEIFRKIPILGQIWSKLGPTHPDFGSKTDFIFLRSAYDSANQRSSGCMH